MGKKLGLPQNICPIVNLDESTCEYLSMGLICLCDTYRNFMLKIQINDCGPDDCVFRFAHILSEIDKWKETVLL